MATDPLAAFIWGSGGAKLSPEQVAERRRMAGELAKKEIPGLGHWAASLNQGLTGFLGGRERRIADEAETLGREGFQSQWDSVFGGGQTASIDPVAAALVGGGGGAAAPASMPTGDNAAYIRQGMIQRGLPEHVADAFLLNMQDESGLNPGINEAAPTVPGSRGGYGLYQLTGPRRRAYEAFAQQKGIPLDSVDGQLDFLMGELAGSESAAAKSILSAPDTGSAAAAIVNNFLRPAESHRARRANSYMGGSYKLPNMTSPAGGQVDPAMLMAQPEQMGAAVSPNMQMPSGGAEQAIAQALSQPQQAPQQAQAPMAPQAPAMGGGQPSMQQLMALAGNEWGSGAQQSIIQSLIGQQMQRQDPMYQLQMQAAQQGLQKGDLELAALRNPVVKPVEVNGRLINPRDGSIIADYSDPKTATVGSTVIDVATGLPIYEGTPEPTANMRDYDAYAADVRAAGGEPIGRLAYEQEVRKAGASSVTTNVAGGNKFDEAFATQDASSLADISNAGIAAQRNLARIDQLGSLLQNSPSGFGAALALQAGEWGIKTDGLDNLQTAQAIINSLVPEQRQPGSGPMSDRDLELFKQSLPRLINSPEGNAQILNTMRAIAQYDAEGAAIVGALRSGDLKRDQAFARLQNRQNPLQNGMGAQPQPAANAQQTATQPNQSQPPRLTTRAEFDAAPSGTVFTAPDGTIRVKP